MVSTQIRPPKAPRPVYRTLDGTRVPSVTTVIGVIAKDFLVRWANKLGLQGIDSTQYVDETAVVGTLAHAWIERHLRGEKFPAEQMVHYSPEHEAGARNAWGAYLRWRREHDVVPLLVEAQLVSERMRVGGTVDLLAEVDGRLEVVDFKTSARVYESHVVQLAAYRSLLEEHGHRVEAVRVVLLPRDGEMSAAEALLSPSRPSTERERVLEDTSHELKVFEAARALYQAQKEMEKAERRNREAAKQATQEAQEQAINWDRFKD